MSPPVLRKIDQSKLRILTVHNWPIKLDYFTSPWRNMCILDTYLTNFESIISFDLIFNQSDTSICSGTQWVSRAVVRTWVMNIIGWWRFSTFIILYIEKKHKQPLGYWENESTVVESARPNFIVNSDLFVIDTIPYMNTTHTWFLKQKQKVVVVWRSTERKMGPVRPSVRPSLPPSLHA